MRAIQDRDALCEAISRELHDKFGQYLTVMDLELAALLDSGEMPTRARLERMRAVTAQAQREMAGMAWQMRPVNLQGLDLASACRQLISEWTARSRLAFDLQVMLGSHKIPPEVETALYRVLQEAIVNAVKHAHARRIGIILQTVAQEAVLIVEDDGQGFSGRDRLHAPHAPLSLGLTGIRERLALVGGDLEIESVPGKGATLLIRVPL